MVVQSLRCVDDTDLGSQVEAEKEKPEKKVEATVSTQRRVSARLQATRQRVEKEELARKRAELLDEKESRSRKRASNGRQKVNVEIDDNENVVVATDKNASEVLEFSEEKTGGEVVIGDSGGQIVGSEKSAFARVKETLRLFNKHYLQFVQEEETRVQTAKNLISMHGSATDSDAKKPTKRPDLKAISKMIGSNAVMYPKKKIGDLPGINVGYQFYSRAEMVAVGFHSHWLNGIDYMGMSYRREKEYDKYTFPLAVAIVLSGMYEDDLDNADEVTYTGQGGHDLNGNKRQIRDQVLMRGNLALKNCVDQDVPVRVVRGHESSTHYGRKVYTYDGLYKVVQYWAEKGISGFTVFKYKLRRLDGQPILTTKQVQFINGEVPQSISEIRGLVCEDISGGLENIPIPATNLVDDPSVLPTGFTYRKDIQVSKDIKLPANATGCNCKESCKDPRTCACAKLNGSDFPYVYQDGGRLIEAKAVVFECGPNCCCGPACVNRTSQRGLKYRLEVFRTPKKGWAVRSWDFIPSGAPICEYVGVLRRAEDMDAVSDNNFIFEIDCLQTMKGLGGRERRLGDVSADSVSTTKNMDRLDDPKSESAPEYCIDAGSTGNIARFINHSCEPNLFVQCVLSSHQDLSLARVMLFAADNIPPLQELTYDYGYVLDSVHGPDGKIKQMACYCGAADCRKRLF